MAETGADFGLRPFFFCVLLSLLRSAVNCVHPRLRSQKIYEQMFDAPISTCIFSVEKLCYSKNSITSRLFLLNGRYLINY